MVKYIGSPRKITCDISWVFFSVVSLFYEKGLCERAQWLCLYQKRKGCKKPLDIAVYTDVLSD